MSWWGEQHHQRGRAYASTRSRSPRYTEWCLPRSTSRANALTIQNFPTSVQELSSELTVLTFKLSNQITLQQPVDTTAISRTSRFDVTIVLSASIWFAVTVPRPLTVATSSTCCTRPLIFLRKETSWKMAASSSQYAESRILNRVPC